MARAPFQVLVLPYCLSPHGERVYAVFRRRDSGAWQGIAGGGEDDESPEEAARREALEEAGIPADARLIPLTSTARIPISQFGDAHRWPAGLTSIPEWSFGVVCEDPRLRLSSEHTTYEWLPFGTAWTRLTWSSNRAALEELDRGLTASGRRSRGARRSR